MNERGTYGSNGHSIGFPQQWTSPTIGADADAPRKKHLMWDAVFTGAFSLLGGYIGMRTTPDDPGKGATIGVATAFFFKLIMDQTSTLKDINNTLGQLR